MYAPDIYEKLIQHFTSEVLSKSMLQKDFEFYHTDMKYKEEFDTYLNNHPEAVYLRLDEMEHPEDFVKIAKVPLKQKKKPNNTSEKHEHAEEDNDET